MKSVGIDLVENAMDSWRCCLDFQCGDGNAMESSIMGKSYRKQLIKNGVS